MPRCTAAPAGRSNPAPSFTSLHPVSLPCRCAAAPQHHNSSTLSSCCWPLPLDCTRPGVNIRLQQNLHSNGLGLNLTKIHSSNEMILRLRYCVSQWHSVTVDATVEGGYIYKVDRCCGAQPSQHRAPCLLIVASSASKSSIRRFVITEKAPTRAFSWLKAATTAFKFKTLC